MADDTTADQNSQTPTETNAPANEPASTDSQDGGQDAGEPGGGDHADDGGSLLGDAAAPGAGDGGEDGKAPTENDADGEGEAAASGPPETYDLKVTTKGEDGSDVEVPIDTVILEKATPLLKELGLTNEQANKLAPLAIDIQQRVATQQADEFKAMKADWAKQAKEDSEIGGAKFNETLALSAKVLDAFGAKSEKNDKGEEQNEFRALLNDTGLGNHPVMLKMFRSIGEQLGEDSHLIRGDAMPQSKKSREEILYPDDVPTKAK